MDADFSHNPREIPNLLTKADKFDVVIGSRYVVGGNIVGFSIWRKLLSFLAQVLCRIVLGLKILDSTSGFRVYKREALKKINVFSIKSQGYSFLIEAIFRCSQKKIATCEVPISFINRARGKSKVSQAEILKALSTVIRLCFA
jgi:glycosyltransferase involved in cell wall biosynthesis